MAMWKEKALHSLHECQKKGLTESISEILKLHPYAKYADMENLRKFGLQIIAQFMQISYY
eukprot:CAMPEP_0202942876 /NCGR_PEP_ID=MMETSP1395-20130829/3113_1 /ASSEMBLY_ACC=CAM_ASM_000871 /TAXON_ID=5961 /ORGANISM="Blepharisma japonicum, Strain Stock R1072" /LENGTH=59 /DNA_ID=CAMNT_0049639619 /DNA_START=891 /DNA_END=1067 /DNA_ORIENTATION=-